MSIAQLSSQLGQSSGPLTVEHHQQIASAHTRSAKIRTAARTATFNGWVTGLFALASAPFAPFSFVSFLVTVGLVVVTYNEFHGRKLLLAFDPQAARLLGWNQVGYLALITAYSLWLIWQGLTGPGPFAKQLEQYPEFQQALGSQADFQKLYQLSVLAIYGAVIGTSVVFQGCTALYYFTRREHIVAYLRETPGWIVEMQRANSAA